MLRYSEILLKLKKFCDYQERCNYEVEKKLKNYNLTNNEKQEIIDTLINDNYLNEDRFLEYFINGKLSYKKWGRVKIEYELSQKYKISRSKISEIIKTIDQEMYNNNCLELIYFKAKNIITNNSEERKIKIFRYLQQKGYEFEMINDNLKKYYNQNNNHTD